MSQRAGSANKQESNPETRKQARVHRKHKSVHVQVCVYVCLNRKPQKTVKQRWV